MLPGELLVLELRDAVLSQLCFYVAALPLHLQPVFVQGLAVQVSDALTYMN